MTQAEFVVDDAVDDRRRVRHADDGARSARVDVTGRHRHDLASADARLRLDAGKHTVFVRALDAAGNWGVVGSVIFNLPKTGPQTTNGSVADVPANGDCRRRRLGDR